MEQMNRPIFWVCSPHHEQGQSEQMPAGSQSQLLQGPGWGSAWGQLHKTRILAFLSWTYFFFFSPPKKCLEHNSTCLYKEDRQNCLEMEAKPDFTQINGQILQHEHMKNVGVFSFFFRTVFPYKSILLKALLPWSSPPTATVTNLW